MPWKENLVTDDKKHTGILHNTKRNYLFNTMSYISTKQHYFLKLLYQWDLYVNTRQKQIIFF